MAATLCHACISLHIAAAMCDRGAPHAPRSDQPPSTCRWTAPICTAAPGAVQLAPCAALALISHPVTRHSFINRVLWAFCVYTEAVSVAPQVLMMQHNKTIEKWTGHYVFFLGVSRFFSCAHWILQMVDGRSTALWTVLLVHALMQFGLHVPLCCWCLQLEIVLVLVARDFLSWNSSRVPAAIKRTTFVPHCWMY
jgi:hypothetical protein